MAINTQTSLQLADAIRSGRGLLVAKLANELLAKGEPRYIDTGFTQKSNPFSLFPFPFDQTSPRCISLIRERLYSLLTKKLLTDNCFNYLSINRLSIAGKLSTRHGNLGKY